MKTEWGVRYGDGEVEIFASREAAERAISEDNEPMALVKRTVVPVQYGPWWDVTGEKE